MDLFGCMVLRVLRGVDCVPCDVDHAMSTMYCVLWCVHVGSCVV